jgi:hypothetical protein
MRGRLPSQSGRVRHSSCGGRSGAHAAAISTLTRMIAPVLRACMSSTCAISSRCPLHGEINGLAAGHTERAARLRQQIDQPQAYRRRGRQRGIASEQLEGERLQSITHQDRRRLVVGFVAGRPATAQIVVIHRRQVIVHERIHVDSSTAQAAASTSSSLRPKVRAVANITRAACACRRRGRCSASLRAGEPGTWGAGRRSSKARSMRARQDS